MANIKKRSYPADTKIIDEISGEVLDTFLNTKEINAELYTYYLSRSDKYPVDENNLAGLWEQRVYKKDIETAKTIGNILGISQPTYRKYRDALLEKGYMVEKEEYYLLPKKESFFFELPLDTIQFLLDTVRKPVIKTLVYLGHQYEWKLATGDKTGYVFTIEELAEHIGEKLQGNKRNYQRINNYLSILSECGFIKISEFYKGKIPKKRIYYLNKNHQLLNKPKAEELV